MANNAKNNSGMPNEHLHELFVDELRDMLGAEKQLLKGLRKMVSKANSDNLRVAFEEHRIQTEEHVERLKKVFASINLSPRGKTCKAMKGLLNEADEIIENFEDAEVLDAALISAAQKVEHYEIASYGCLVTYAKLMEHHEATKLLNRTLEEEKNTDSKLTEIAMEEANMAV